MDRLQEELNDLKVEGQFEDGLRNLVKGTHEIQIVYGGECLAKWSTFHACKHYTILMLCAQNVQSDTRCSRFTKRSIETHSAMQ